jgi:hypothetical protein
LIKPSQYQNFAARNIISNRNSEQRNQSVKAPEEYGEVEPEEVSRKEGEQRGRR